MLISRTLARRRIAAGVRPSFRAAWLPVAADIAIIVALLALLWNPALTFIYVMQLSLVWLIIFLLVVIYLPFQVVATLSTLWAVMSRAQDDDNRAP